MMKHFPHFLIMLALATGLTLSSLARPQPVYAVPCAQFHVVQRRENLFRIGLRYGYRFTYLQALNGLRNPNLIFAGQRLCVKPGR